MKNRFLLVLGVILLLSVTVAAVSRPFSSTSKSTDLSWPARPVIALAADHSYDAVEQVRLANASADHSYDAVEQVRLANAYKFSSYDKIEQIRSGRGLNADHSYDKIEAIRLQS